MDKEGREQRKAKTFSSIVIQVQDTTAMVEQGGTGWQQFLIRRRQMTMWQNLPAYLTGEYT